MTTATRISARSHSTFVDVMALVVTALVSIAAHSQPQLRRPRAAAGTAAILRVALQNAS